MYAIGQKVWVKSHARLATVAEANYSQSKPRYACYVVLFDDSIGHDYLTGTHDLRAADWQCDECHQWLPNNKRTHVEYEYEYEGNQRIRAGIIGEYCFTCVKKFEREAGYIL